MPSPKSIGFISLAFLILCVALSWPRANEFRDVPPPLSPALAASRPSSGDDEKRPTAPIEVVPFAGSQDPRASLRVGTGIVGVVESPRFTQRDGRRGVRPGMCLIRADAVTQSKSTTTFEVGLGGETRADEAGYFALPLAEGDWRIVVNHYPGQSAEPYLVELWYARITLKATDATYRNLGVIRLSELALRGTVRRPDGSVIAIPMGATEGVSVTFSDKRLDATQGIAGCEFSITADPEGRFAIAVARADEGWVKGTLRAEYRRARVVERDVVMGDVCFLALDLDAIPGRAEPLTRLMIDGDDGTLAVWHDDTERPIVVEVSDLPKSPDGHRVFTTRLAADAQLSYELRCRDSRVGWRVSSGSFVAKADGVPHHVEAPSLSGREVTGYVGRGTVRRLAARSGGRHVVVDEVHAGPDGRFRLVAVPGGTCTLVTARGTLVIPASDAPTTDVGVVGAQSGEAR